MEKLFFAFFAPILVYARIEQDVMPQFLEDCYSNIPSRSHGELEKQTTCLEQYLQVVQNNVTSIKLDKTAINWIDSLGQKVHLRLKRQAINRITNIARRVRNRGNNRASRIRNNGRNRYNNNLRVRKEIRTLSNRELANFLDAVNALKKDTSVKPNKYDAFALAHQGDATAGAHRGPNFVSWHRYMLVLVEEALRTKIRGVTIPYWDSRLDFRMSKPEDTILFTEVLLGNGVGVVYTGPFAYWETPADNTLLRRDIPGRRSSLVDPNRVKNVFTKRYHREILNPTAATPDDNLEDHHDGVHRWVGGSDGHMGDLLLSPMDPVFYLHHCFIDYLWEQFRERQTKLGINSETDYPTTNVPLHGPNDIMANLKPDRKNIWGYSNHFTRRIYRYADAPECKNRCGYGRNAFLYCDRRQNACVSRTKQDFIGTKGFEEVDRLYTQGGVHTISNASLPTVLLAPVNEGASRSRPAPKITQRFKDYIVDDRTVGRKRRSILPGDSFSDNIYANIDGAQPDTASIAVSPVAIKTLSFSKTSTVEQYDLYPRDFIYNVTFETVGFSYEGIYTDQILVDGKTTVSESVGLMAFERPIVGATSALVRAYDSFGNLCQVNCLTSDQTYTDCTGMLKITPDQPLMYKDTSNGDSYSTIRPFIKFICEK